MDCGGFDCGGWWLFNLLLVNNGLIRLFLLLDNLLNFFLVIDQRGQFREHRWQQRVEVFVADGTIWDVTTKSKDDLLDLRAEAIDLFGPLVCSAVFVY